MTSSSIGEPFELLCSSRVASCSVLSGLAQQMDLSEDLFELNNKETVVVYLSSFLWTMIFQPSQLDCLMKIIQKIKPCIMVINEVEANHSSLVFANHFIEALFFDAAFFNSVEDCMDCDEPNKAIVESFLFSQGITNIVGSEGAKRTIRQVSFNVWRVFFAQFGMVDMELSTSLYQASLMANNFACGSSCTLEMDGNCLIIGWKGTPLLSLSA